MPGIARGTTELDQYSLAGAGDVALALLAQWLPGGLVSASGDPRLPNGRRPAQAAALSGVALLIAWTSQTAVTQFIYFKF